jgi:superfamily II DNA helicase RecQ
MNNNNNLFELLREKRNQIAKENKLEPFMVLQNSVLEEIAQKQPKTLEALSKIKFLTPIFYLTVALLLAGIP